MQYENVLICEANESEREVFSATLADCYINHCHHLEEVSECLRDGDYDAVFIGPSIMIDIMNGRVEVLEDLVPMIDSGTIFMFHFSHDFGIQVKRVSLIL